MLIFACLLAFFFIIHFIYKTSTQLLVTLLINQYTAIYINIYRLSISHFSKFDAEIESVRLIIVIIVKSTIATVNRIKHTTFRFYSSFSRLSTAFSISFTFVNIVMNLVIARMTYLLTQRQIILVSRHFDAKKN